MFSYQHFDYCIANSLERPALKQKDQLEGYCNGPGETYPWTWAIVVAMGLWEEIQFCIYFESQSERIVCWTPKWSSRWHQDFGLNKWKNQTAFNEVNASKGRKIINLILHIRKPKPPKTAITCWRAYN